ncbi:GspE/PulE family protein [Escherichia coli]|uniref:GspE/PulE family protein n=1 Tax=Escherichia coli TaxID=562 RepID=UPI001692AAED|nr:ATPase, T2SS/T4P/T4SS family [Escherichia coli]EEU9261457.1 DNA-binding protein [Escherichia coli]EFJ1802926.1 Flp pilus assembly complex ATPase component [Escherichia coli]EFO4711191.1 DNA-binding protein [Escherichia coli]EIR2337473.1 Flp pilus assembly complex ATPase component TadA [Escherichia coli]MCQ0124535.1 Flp pilus assembly complex ATPase component TadA [Escherichia coli]
MSVTIFTEADYGRLKNNLHDIIAVDEELSKFSVMFSSGDFLVSEEHTMHPSVRFMREVAFRRGIRTLREYHVNLKIIRTFHSLHVMELSRVNNQPMEVMASKLITECVNSHASDLHIKIAEHYADIYIRKDGDMLFLRQIESTIAHKLLATLYNNADDADATYKVNAYQAARIVSSRSRLSIPDKVQSVRLQYNPLGNGGRYFIARFLYVGKREVNEHTYIELQGLGFHPLQINAFTRLRRLSIGVNIISGPTGSGKSTTLKNMLELLYEEKKKKVNIISIEDPPEYEIEGTAQLPVTNVETEEERGAEYRKAIIAALRSDPDIIMPGEARDAEVISLVFTAAMTGHQVWTSLHANSALAIFDRLKDQGVDDFKLSDPDLLTGLIAQRLVKKLCPDCSLSLSEYETINGIIGGIDRKLIEGHEATVRFPNLNGCSECFHGYIGRTIVAEVIEPDYKFLELVSQGKRQEATKYWLTQLNGMTMTEHAWLKMVEGSICVYDATAKVSHIDKISSERKSFLIGTINRTV